MEFRSKRIYAMAVISLLLVVSLLVGCNRSATEDQPTVVPKATDEVPIQTMGTPTTAPDQPVAPEPVDMAVPDQPEEPHETTEPEPVEPAEPAEPEPAEPEQEPATEQSYIVLPGDTLFSVAQYFGLTMEEIATRNGIVNVDQLEVGQELVIPVAGGGAPPDEQPTGEVVHVVQAGENLFRISLKYNQSFETVAAYNNIPWPYYIYPGQVIKIPPLP